MRSINKVIMIGHLASDPEVNKTKTGKTVASFSLATNRDWVNSEGEKQSETDFHKVIVWEKLADIVGKYLAKGSAIYLEGRVSNRTYESPKDKTKKYITEMVGDIINVLTWKKDEKGNEVVNIKNPS